MISWITWGTFLEAHHARQTDLRLTVVRKWITDGRVVREEQRDAGGRPDYVTRHRRVCLPLIITPLP